MYRVLLAIDEDETRARRAAQAVASLPGQEDLDVLLLNVFEEFDVADEAGTVSSSDLYEDTDFPESVSVALEILGDAGVTVTTRREHGDPAAEILAVAEEIDADCIALSGRKRSPAGKVLFGSVTQSVLLSADRPVLNTIGE